MRRWKPKPGVGLVIGIVLLLAALAGCVLLALRMVLFFTQPPELWQFNLEVYGEFVAFVACVLLASVLLYRVAGALTLSYEMDRNGLYIVWIGNRAVIPLGQIERVDIGVGEAHVPLRPLRLAGFHGGRGRTTEDRPLHFFTTTALSRSLVIHTTEAAYVVSPGDQDSFVQELEQRRKIGAVKPLQPTVEPGRMLFYAFWNDQVVRRALIVALGLHLLLLGILALRYPELTDLVAMRFDAAGQITEQRPRHQVLFLPMAALALILLNTGLGVSFYRRDKTSAQLLQLGSVLVQVLFGVALLSIIGI